MKNYTYLCNGKACNEMCANKSKEEWDAFDCHHTTDERYARNKCRRERKFQKITTESGTVKMVEIDPRDK